MAAQIIPRGTEVSDRFPTLGFTLQSGHGIPFEVALATDPSLFKPENRARRNSANFYTSREEGRMYIDARDSVYVVPSRVLERFAGTDRLYFALVAAHGGTAGLDRAVLLPMHCPFVSLRNFTGGSLRRQPVDGPALRPPVLDGAGRGINPAGSRINPPVQENIAKKPRMGR